MPRLHAPLSDSPWNAAVPGAHGLRSWAFRWKSRRASAPSPGFAPEMPADTAASGAPDTEAPASHGERSRDKALKSIREQYGISAMLYGLVVLVCGVFCAMDDTSRLASERSFALEAAYRTPRFAPERGHAPPARPTLEVFSTEPLRLPAPPPRRLEGTELPDTARAPAAVPNPRKTQLEQTESPRYATARNGA